jgi:ceramide glucosyltransferase
MAVIDTVFLGAVVFAAIYWVAALACVCAFARRPLPTARVYPPATVLKPLKGDDGHLYDNLRSFCQQDYPVFEVICGVQDRDDAAAPVVQRLIREFPGLDVRLVIDPRTIGTNRKVSNLANLVRHARHDTLVVADSDMRVGPSYLRTVVGPLHDARVGLVTCLYRGVASSGLASRLGAMFINAWFLPAALVGARLERLRHAFGATIACRRAVLDAIGGFEVTADRLADDYVLGRLVSDLGLRLALVPYVVENVVVERNVVALVLHELRWARTFRTLRPLPYLGSLLTYGIPLSGLWLLVSFGSGPALIAAVVHIAFRCVGQAVLRRALAQPASWSETWLIPLRDVLSFVIGIASFFGRTVRWNDERLRVQGDGRLARAADATSRRPLDGAHTPAPLGSEREEPA